MLISKHHVTRDVNPSWSNQLALTESWMRSTCCFSLFLSWLSEPKPTGVLQPSSRDVRGQKNINNILSAVFDFLFFVALHFPFVWPSSKTLSHLDLSSTPEVVHFLCAPFTETSPNESWGCTLQYLINLLEDLAQRQKKEDIGTNNLIYLWKCKKCIDNSVLLTQSSSKSQWEKKYLYRKTQLIHFIHVS